MQLFPRLFKRVTIKQTGADPEIISGGGGGGHGCQLSLTVAVRLTMCTILGGFFTSNFDNFIQKLGQG